MTDRVDLTSLSDAEVLGLTLFGEARGEPVEGRIAVASVIRNRMQAGRFGATFRAVCLAPKQFSCWQAIDGALNFARLQELSAAIVGEQPWPLSALESAILRECFWIADGIVSGALRSRVGHATHYITAQLWATHPPAWARGHEPVATVGHQVFFELHEG